LIKLGVINQETWSFFNEIFADLSKNYQTTLFKPRHINTPFFSERINRYLFRTDLTRFLKSNDVVYVEWASRMLAEVTKLPKACKIVTRLHRYEMYQWVNKINWQPVDKIIVVSQVKKGEFLQRFPGTADKIVVSSPSTSLEKFVFQEHRFRGNIGTLCHISPRKRVYELILDFYEISRCHEGLHLHIAGGVDPEYEDYSVALHNLVDELHLKDQVTFYGNVKEPWNWYSKLDIFISNSYSEGLQVALMEAMASGCCCFSHRWSGAEEMLPVDNLFFTPSELKDKVLTYIALPEAEKKALSTQMRDIACEKFDLKLTISEIKQVIDDVAK
jgi:glycosyltransferase involved in cell wall biosynthesis